MMYRNGALAIATGVLLCGVTACSGSADGDQGAVRHKAAQKPVQLTPAAAVKRAADNNQGLTSLSYSMRGKVPGSGTVDADASMTMKPLAMTMRTKTSGSKDPEENGEMEIRLVGDGVYLGGKSLAAEAGGKKWIKFPVNAADGSTDELGPVGSQASGNPADTSAAMTASKDLRRIGKETVDGTSTTHYAGTVTFAALRAGTRGQGAEARKRTESTIKAYQGMGLEKLTMDMWIDGSDHTKQFRMRGAADKGPLDMLIKFLGINKPVTVKAPPASETMALADAMNSADAA